MKKIFLQLLKYQRGNAYRKTKNDVVQKGVGSGGGGEMEVGGDVNIVGVW